jgi:hypothetical protein
MISLSPGHTNSCFSVWYILSGFSQLCFSPAFVSDFDQFSISDFFFFLRQHSPGCPQTCYATQVGPLTFTSVSQVLWLQVCTTMPGWCVLELRLVKHLEILRTGDIPQKVFVCSSGFIWSLFHPPSGGHSRPRPSKWFLLERGFFSSWTQQYLFLI